MPWPEAAPWQMPWTVLLSSEEVVTTLLMQLLTDHPPLYHKISIWGRTMSGSSALLNCRGPHQNNGSNVLSPNDDNEEPRSKRPPLTSMTILNEKTLHWGCLWFVSTMPTHWRICGCHYLCVIVLHAGGAPLQVDNRTMGAKDTVGSATAASKFLVGILVCGTIRSREVTNALDFIAWRRRGPDKVVVAATCTSSSSLLGYLHSGWDNRAVGAEDAAASATATTKYIAGIIACTMASSSTLLNHHGPCCLAAERSQGCCCCIEDDDISDIQHQWPSLLPPRHHNWTHKS